MYELNVAENQKTKALLIEAMIYGSVKKLGLFYATTQKKNGRENKNNKGAGMR